MIVKRYSGRTAEEALAMAKLELGDDAIILSSGKARDHWWKFWQSGYQVLVATDYPRRNGAASSKEAAPTVLAPAAGPVVEVAHPPLVEPPPLPEDPRLSQVLTLLEGMGERLERMEGLGDDQTLEAYQFFLDRGVSEGWSRKLAEAVRVRQQEEECPREQAIRETLMERLGPPAPIALAEPATVLFVGPTGSGKTTTIAKLAAYCHLERQKSVLLISTDTFRVAAVEQLKTYSEIIGVPFQVALRPQDIPHILKDRKWDVVLIDTAGHSLNHALYMSEIRTIQQLSQATDVQLVIPATMEAGLMCETAQVFADGLDAKICFTKIDEVRRPGALWTAALTLGWPLSYLTDGQNVPDDIQAAFPETLVNLMMGGER
ncbi:flagellar biosynthesis protein FlhF [Sulfobacillus harzensis]|uniref:Flagellar biosynthesis protein FlhF n=1 Tax=Sulfobacillus harzensis TaxID=2729629 RepID=A0A7Y0Q3K3_9FIRM|nr:flagellar biosynthesis protein FlhF [Sulfobacillus harzensis]NMP23071.1 flagellar biosynthesis protein FlhF [Sulfobacillus harzensis]